MATAGYYLEYSGGAFDIWNMYEYIVLVCVDKSVGINAQ